VVGQKLVVGSQWSVVSGRKKQVKINFKGLACGFGRTDGFSITIGRVHALMEYAQNSYSVRLLPIDDHMDADGKCSVWLVQVVPKCAYVRIP